MKNVHSERFWVKICGLTRADDWKVCAEAGADLVGLVFFPPSKRALTPRQAEAMARANGWKSNPPAQANLRGMEEEIASRGLPLRVGVFVNPTAEEIEDAVEAAALDVIQLHGDAREEGYRTAEKLGLAVIQAVAVGDRLGDRDFAGVAGSAPPAAFLCDTAKTGFYGGTGETFDHQLLRPWIESHPILLAGGLDDENVANTIARAGNVLGCDVSSGVEAAPGVKDHDKIRRFVEGARRGHLSARLADGPTLN